MADIEYVYLIEDDLGKVKIGQSSDPVTRLVQLQTANSGNLRLLGCIVGDKEHERYLHRKYCSQKVSGEWFSLRASDVLDILANEHTRYKREGYVDGIMAVVDMMIDFANRSTSKQGRHKDGRVPVVFGMHKMVDFVAWAKEDIRKLHLRVPIRSSSLARAIRLATQYDQHVRSIGYLPVRCGDVQYSVRFVHDWRCFVIVTTEQFRSVGQLC